MGSIKNLTGDPLQLSVTLKYLCLCSLSYKKIYSQLWSELSNPDQTPVCEDVINISSYLPPDSHLPLFFSP